MTRLEKEIEKKLRDRVRAAGGWCLKWVCPGWVGVPDRIILLPGGKVIFAETKRPKGGRVDPMQIWWGDQIQALGFRYHLIWSTDDVNDFCAEYLKE